MSSRGQALLLVVLCGPPAFGQMLDIYSELSRPDPFGGVVASDRSLSRREILSPAVARNGWASFHIVVSVPPKESYLLYVIPNPISACRVALYREHFVRTKSGWVPDGLTELTQLPDFGTMPDPSDGVEGQTTRAYLLDLWIPPNADVARFRLEVQLKVGEWEVRPMEVRVMQARYPDVRSGPASVPGVEDGADAAALAAYRETLAGRPLRVPAELTTVRDILWRNAVQDMGLAASLEPGALMSRVLDLFRANSVFARRPMGSEWYLKIRDYLYSRP